ncbi:unnamed protein product [Notodromas monacha]|uniref:Leucine-rich repeat-containing protein 57 n=1 Tax=Notodromas monacha TaxID=399045 RepID=A0A7R9BJP1_9CRUS|nr:unnamed protein product [Notodromas monacha]CAG0916704.1 unnamed protein product [Notodromas monacha]
MGNSSSGGLKDHIANAQKTGILQLAQRKLTNVPPEVLELSANLKTLDLSQNKLKDIPPQFGSLKTLRNLNVSENKLESLPDELGSLIKLESLMASKNHLKSLPNSLSNWKALRKLILSDNVLNEFPEFVCQLPNLDIVDLSGNSINSIPDCAGTLSTTELNLNRNQVSSISPLLAKSARLKSLRLEENCLSLSAIPIELLKNSNVSLMAVEGNLFAMKEFIEIDGYDEYMERFTATKKKFGT